MISLGREVVKDYDLCEPIQYDEGTVGSNYSLDQSGEDLIIRMSNITPLITLLQTSKSDFDVDEWLQSMRIDDEDIELVAQLQAD